MSLLIHHMPEVNRRCCPPWASGWSVPYWCTASRSSSHTFSASSAAPAPTFSGSAYACNHCAMWINQECIFVLYIFPCIHGDIVRQLRTNNPLSLLKRRFLEVLGWAWRETLAEDHRSWTCPGPLAAPTGFEVQPPHRRWRSSAPRLLHGGGRIIATFRHLPHT